MTGNELQICISTDTHQHGVSIIGVFDKNDFLQEMEKFWEECVKVEAGEAPATEVSYGGTSSDE